MTTLRAHFDGKVLVPKGLVELPIGCELELQVTAVQPAEAAPLEELASIADEFPDNPAAPTDAAAQLDHYLYGLPKTP